MISFRSQCLQSRAPLAMSRHMLSVPADFRLTNALAVELQAVHVPRQKGFPNRPKSQHRRRLQPALVSAVAIWVSACLLAAFRRGRWPGNPKGGEPNRPPGRARQYYPPLATTINSLRIVFTPTLGNLTTGTVAPEPKPPLAIAPRGVSVPGPLKPPRPQLPRFWR
jgi:hypothetical protein